MARKKRRNKKSRANPTVADRQRSLEPTPLESNIMLSAMRTGYKRQGHEEFPCTISEYCRTQVFEFPRIDFRPNGDEPHHIIYASPSVQASVASNLVDYFVNSTSSKHYAVSPSLRHGVAETEENIKLRQKGLVPVFLIIEEFNELTPVGMVNGECSISDEVVVRDGEKVPILVGGREGEKFITAWATIDGEWPELPNNQQLVNMILAGVRVGQQTSSPIPRHFGQDGIVTDEGRFVEMVRFTMSGRGSTATVMDTAAYRSRASEINRAIKAMERDLRVPHVALLFNSMYSDEYKEDAYQRLQYLQLWQSLSEAGEKYLNYQGDIRKDNVVVAGEKTLVELRDYRDAIAHWRTATIDENFLADLQRTINELVRLKYF